MKKLLFALLFAVSALALSAQSDLKARLTKSETGRYYVTVSLCCLNPSEKFSPTYKIRYAGSKKRGQYELAFSSLEFTQDGQTLKNFYAPYNIRGRMKIKLQDGATIDLHNSNMMSKLDYEVYSGMYTTDALFTLSKKNIDKLIQNPPVKVRFEVNDGFVDKTIDPVLFVETLTRALTLIEESLNAEDYDSDF